MSFDLPKEIIIWDTEYTSWPNAFERAWTGPGEIRELVQIGAVRVRTSDFTELDSFEVLIKPDVNPTLSDYFIKLTGISQAEVDKNGKTFKEACKMFFDWVGEANLYSWSDGDLYTLIEDCRRTGIVLPVKANRFYEMRMVFWKYGIAAENYQSSTIIQAFGQKPKRSAHSALNDARTIVDGLRALKNKIQS